ncbi:MAG: twin-arginine translocase subunit TatC, partial [Endomicrobiia bacterium]
IIQILRYPSTMFLDKLIFTYPTEMVVTYFKVSIFLGAILSSPAILYNLWLFIKPAVSKEIKFNFFLWLLIILVLFVLGIFFAYVIILPYGLKFLLTFGTKVAYPMISLNNYISFVLTILVITGIIFEMPVFCAMLTKLKILTPAFLRKKRKEALFALITVAAIITPTTDVFNLILFVSPMILLYEISIWVSYFVIKFSVSTDERVYFYE